MRVSIVIRSYNEEKDISRMLNIQLIGTEYGSTALDPELIPEGSTIISAGIGEDISFDMELIRLKNCNVIGIDPTEKSKVFVEKNSHPKFHFLNKALFIESGTKIRMFRNANPSHVSDSVTATHKAVSGNNSYYAETTSIPELLAAYPDISLIKLDIEGAEYETLASLKKLDVPQLCVGFHIFCTGFTLDHTIEVASHVVSLGYVIANIINRNGPMSEVLFIHRRCLAKSTFNKTKELVLVNR
jgi:FkbM family methyltransferase